VYGGAGEAGFLVGRGGPGAKLDGARLSPAGFRAAGGGGTLVDPSSNPLLLIPLLGGGGGAPLPPTFDVEEFARTALCCRRSSGVRNLGVEPYSGRTGSYLTGLEGRETFDEAASCGGVGVSFVRREE
jgi:hypothetical protein